MNCSGCYYFNNFKYKGHNLWSDYAEIYQRWSTRLKIGRANILGGEPLVNPSFTDWVKNIRLLFDPADRNITTSSGSNISLPQLEITSNGTQIKEGFVEFLKENSVMLSVSIHNKKLKTSTIDNIKQQLKTPIRWKIFNEDPYHQRLIAIDADNFVVKFTYDWWFGPGPLIETETTGKYTLHNSDPIKSHNNCTHKVCHTFKNGKLYKCGTVAQFEDFDNQFELVLSNEDRELIKSYRPLEVTASDEEFAQFLDTIDDPIPQCKFCPEVYAGEQIHAEVGNKKIIPIRSQI